MPIYKDYETMSGIKYSHRDREPMTMSSGLSEYGAFLYQLYADCVRDQKHYAVSGFIADINDALFFRHTFPDIRNNYAVSLYVALHSLGDAAYDIAPIHDIGTRDEIEFRPSAESAEHMNLPYDKVKRAQIYPKLAKKIEKFTGLTIDISRISKHFEDAKERGNFEPAKTMVDWLYSTLFRVLSNEELMFISEMSYGDYTKIISGLIYESLVNVIGAGADRANALTQKELVIANLDENKYFLSLPLDLNKTGEKPVLITRQ